VKLTLFRRWREGDATIGELFVGDQADRFSYTLEDRVHDGPKIPGQTAIPAGTYRIVISRSARFQCEMPEVCDVPGFTGVRIHPGNTPKDTDGCILVGYGRQPAAITESRLAYSALIGKIAAALLDGEAIVLEIINVFEAAA
jgi:hypothetical protein